MVERDNDEIEGNEHLDSAHKAWDKGNAKEAESKAKLAKESYEKIKDKEGIKESIEKCDEVISSCAKKSKADDLLGKARRYIGIENKKAKKLAKEVRKQYEEIDFPEGMKDCNETISLASKNINYGIDWIIEFGAFIGKITGIIIILASLVAFGYLIWSAVYSINSHSFLFNLSAPPESKEVFIGFAKVIEGGLLVITILVIGAGVLSLLRRFAVEEKNINHLKKQVISMLIIMMAIAMFEAFLSISKLDETSLGQVTLLVYISVAFGIVIASLGTYIWLTKEKEE